MIALYIKILRQALGLARIYKIFWSASLFLLWPTFFKSLAVLVMGSAAFGVLLLAPETVGSGSSDAGEGVLSGILFGLAAAFLVWAYFKARGIVILSVKQIQESNATDWPQLNKQSSNHLFNLVTASYSCLVILAALTAVYLAPVLYLNKTQHSVRALILLIFGVLAFVPLMYFIYAVMRLLPLFVTVYKLSTKNSLVVSLDFAYRRWRLLLGFMAFMFVLELLVLVVLVSMVLVLNQPFVILSQIFYDVGGLSGLLTLNGLAGIALFMLFFVLQAIVAVANHIAWVLLFLQVVKPITFATDEEPEVVEPEAAT
jgi:hypothetical protein